MQKVKRKHLLEFKLYDIPFKVKIYAEDPIEAIELLKSKLEIKKVELVDDSLESREDQELKVVA